MQYIFLNDRWPFRVETIMPDDTPLTVDEAYVTITRIDDMVVVLPRTSVPGHGIYSGYIEYLVEPPITSTIGNYSIDWDILLSGVLKSYKTFFNVALIPTYTELEQELIEALAIRLKDNRPYLYRVDAPERKWHDEELYSFLYYALSDINASPPMWTAYDFGSVPPQLYGMMLLAAQIEAVIAEATLQAANDFSYNDNGLTVTLSRSGKYMQIASFLWGRYSVMIFKIKRTLAFTLTHFVGVKTQRMPISVRKGKLRQQLVIVVRKLCELGGTLKDETIPSQASC